MSPRLFAARLNLVRALDAKHERQSGRAEDAAPYDAGDGAPPDEGSIRKDAVDQLRETIGGMNLDSFMVQRRRRTVEKYLRLDVWFALDDRAREEFVGEVSPLPSAKRHGTEDAKRFDLLMFSLQLALLKGPKQFDNLRKNLL